MSGRRARPIRSAGRSLGKRWRRDLRAASCAATACRTVSRASARSPRGVSRCWASASSPSTTRHSAGDEEAAREHLPVVLRAEARRRRSCRGCDRRRAPRAGRSRAPARTRCACRRRSAGPRAGPRPPTGCAAPDIPTPRAASRTSASTSPRPGHGVGEQRRDGEHRAREHGRGVAEQAARGERGCSSASVGRARVVLATTTPSRRAPAAVTEPEARSAARRRRPAATARHDTTMWSRGQREDAVAARSSSAGRSARANASWRTSTSHRPLDARPTG